MATITAKDVAALRAKTGIGMMECKKALVEADGDFEAAIKLLREKGELKAASKIANRIAADGIVAIMKEGDLTAPDTTSIRPRWEFVGYISNDETKELVGRKIEWGDFKGCQNSCIYTNFLKTKSLADAPEDDEKMTGEERVELNGSAS